MVAAYRAGVGPAALARKYGVSDSTVRAQIKAAGVALDLLDRQRERYHAANNEMMRLRDDGWTHREIGQKFGITRQAVGRRLRRR